MVSQHQLTLHSNPNEEGKKSNVSCQQFIQHKTYASNHFPFFPETVFTVLGTPVVPLPTIFFFVDFGLPTP